jgi:hypothetical protein
MKALTFNNRSLEKVATGFALVVGMAHGNIAVVQYSEVPTYQAKPNDTWILEAEKTAYLEENITYQKLAKLGRK